MANVIALLQFNNLGLLVTPKSQWGICFQIISHSDVYIHVSSKITANQVYQGSTERKLCPRFHVKNQSCTIEKGNLHVTWPGTTKEFDTKNPLKFAQWRQPLDRRSYGIHFFFSRKECMRRICMTVVSCSDVNWAWIPNTNKSLNLASSNFKTPVGFEFMKIFSLSQRENQFGLQNKTS